MLTIGKILKLLIAGEEVTVKGSVENKVFIFRTDYKEASIKGEKVDVKFINELYHHGIIEADSGNWSTGERHLKWCLDTEKQTL